MFRLTLSSVLAVLALATAAHASAPAPTRTQQRYESQFMTAMIDHHAMAVMMADLCLERAVHPELLALCHEIRETQLEEIATMQTWLEQWYGIDHEPQMTPGAQKQMQKLSSLSGAEFEIEFMKTMIRHHATAVVRAQQCQEKAYHPELIQLCGDIEAAQMAEIELMTNWLCEWYGICDFRADA